jgi:hypothetical protein
LTFIKYTNGDIKARRNIAEGILVYAILLAVIRGRN